MKRMSFNGFALVGLQIKTRVHVCKDGPCMGWPRGEFGKSLGFFRKVRGREYTEYIQRVRGSCFLHKNLTDFAFHVGPKQLLRRLQPIRWRVWGNLDLYEIINE